MKVLMAIRAGGADMGKHRLFVALTALGVDVKSFQLKTGDRMVEVLHPAFFIPGLFGVAQCTIEIHVTVGVANPRGLALALAESDQGGQQQYKKQTLHRSSPRGSLTLT